MTQSGPSRGAENTTEAQKNETENTTQGRTVARPPHLSLTCLTTASSTSFLATLSLTAIPFTGEPDDDVATGKKSVLSRLMRSVSRVTPDLELSCWVTTVRRQAGEDDRERGEQVSARSRCQRRGMGGREKEGLTVPERLDLRLGKNPLHSLHQRALHLL